MWAGHGATPRQGSPDSNSPRDLSSDTTVVERLGSDDREVVWEVRHGSPFNRALEAARDHHVDAVILFQRMRNPWKRLIKQRYYPMLGFGTFESASRFCTAFDELRNYLRGADSNHKGITAAEKRTVFTARWSTLMAELAA